MSWDPGGRRGANDPPNRKAHALRNRYRKDPRSEADRRSEGTGRNNVAPRRDREYFCTCGVSYGNVVEHEAAQAHRDHKAKAERDAR